MWARRRAIVAGVFVALGALYLGIDPGVATDRDPEVIAILNVGDVPFGIGMNPVTNRLYVTNRRRSATQSRSSFNVELVEREENKAWKLSLQARPFAALDPSGRVLSIVGSGGAQSSIDNAVETISGSVRIAA